VLTIVESKADPFKKWEANR